VKLPIALRPALSGDYNFVLSSWLKSYFRNRQLFAQGAQLSEREYFVGHQRMVKWLLDRAPVLVACNPDDESQIYGWACYEEDGDTTVLHYVYVKAPYRGYGVGRTLFTGLRHDSVRVVCTHWTRRLSDDKAESKYNVERNPYCLWLEKPAA
jgi:GNAT superfamily N-acetyltransferase